MPDQLFELNSLTKNSAQVWVNPNASEAFGYSDGDDEEQYLIRVLESCSDLSVDSIELAAAIQDWASEYHLSSARSNLLKAIKLPENSKILELGCGCGAVTRFLAEQGHQVTAVEGSVNRAKIARLRNRDMNNVEIIAHNFNALNLSEDHYDAVLFIGVLEYAKRFADKDDISSEQAVIDLLNKTRLATNNNGLIIIAIENRVGLKYEQGALEDHLAIPDVGLDNYVGYEFTGIKTYDYSQWQDIFRQCDLSNKFYYPFPDYKLPSMVINGQVEQQDRCYLSTQINSYDPISEWIGPDSESKLWQHVLDHGTLNQKANSFGIVASKSEKTASDIFNNDWCLYDSINKNPGFRVNLTNNYSNDSFNNKEIVQLFNNSNNISSSLKDDWQKHFSTSPTLKILCELTDQLFQFTKHNWPSNILVDFDQIGLKHNNSSYEYGKYWQLPTNVSAEQQIFHVLITFCFKSQKLLRTSPEFKFLSFNDLISSCLDQAYVDYQHTKDEYIRLEEIFLNTISHRKNSINELLSTVISNLNYFDFAYVNSQLFFARQADHFTSDQSKLVRQKQTGKLTKLVFEKLNMSNPYLRFDPCDHQHGNGHYFIIHSVDLLDMHDDVVFTISLVENIQLRDLKIIDAARALYKVNGIDSQIIFSLPTHLKNTAASYNLEMQLQWLGN